ncbi:MAG: hypothetical protein JNL39_01075 [Opitutaceae bacterium]|nr:hypothetical protein [Opitutaceae bacterium]
MHSIQLSPSALRRRVRVALAPFAIVLFALCAAAQSPTASGQRLREIDTEIGRVASQAATLAEKIQDAPAADRARLIQQLKDLQRHDTALRVEQAQLRRASGAGTAGSNPSLPSGGPPLYTSVLPPSPVLSVTPPPTPAAVPDGAPAAAGTQSAKAPDTPQPSKRPAFLPPARRQPDAELTPDAKHALAAEKFVTLEKLRSRAPAVRARLALLEDMLAFDPATGRPAIGTARTGMLADIAQLKEEQTQIGNQISLLEESIESLGCDPATGKPKPAAPAKPAVADPRAPTFDFSGTWLLRNAGGTIGKMTVEYTDSPPGIIDCNDTSGATAHSADRRFIRGRIEFASERTAFHVLYYSTGYGRWKPIPGSGGTPLPGVFVGCVTADGAEIWLHPENGNTPDCRLRIKGDGGDKSRARIDGQSLARSYTETSTYRWWDMKKQ